MSNDDDLKETNRTLTRVCFWLGHRLRASGGHGDSGAQDHCCQTWSRWKAGKKKKKVKKLSPSDTSEMLSQKNQAENLFFFLHSVWVIERAQIWTALLQWCYSHQNLFGLLRRPHEPHSVCSQLWRPTAPSRTRAQTQQHLTKNQGQQWHQHSFMSQYLTEVTCTYLNLCSSGWVSMSAHISDPFSGWYWAADVAGFNEWSDGGEWRPACFGVAAER